MNINEQKKVERALANIVGGDIIVLERRIHSTGGTQRLLEKVTKLTPTQFVLQNGDRYYRPGFAAHPGSHVGYTGLNYYLIGKATAGEIKADADKKALEKAAQDSYQKETLRKDSLRAELNAQLDPVEGFVNFEDDREAVIGDKFTVHLRHLNKAQVEALAKLLLANTL